MRKLLALTVGLLALTAVASAQELPDVAVTSDHPLYDVKTSVEESVEEAAPNETAKAQAKTEQAETRLAEAETLADQNKSDLAAKAAGNYTNEMQELQDLGSQVSDLAQQREIDELIATATNFHSQVLSRIYEKVPAEAQSAISNALNQSVQGHQEAISRMEQRGQSTAGMGNMSANIPDNVQQQTGVTTDRTVNENIGVDETSGAGGQNGGSPY